jgi:hypothetical protein
MACARRSGGDISPARSPSGRIGLFYFEGKKESHYLNNTSGQPNPVWQLRGPL